MTPAQATSMYRRRLGQFETIIIRKYSGSGLSQTTQDWSVSARVMEFAASELVGAVVQGDQKVIVLHEDLANATSPAVFTFPIGTSANWKAVVRGRELQIKSVDGNTRRLRGTAIAYDLVVGG